MLEVKVFGLHQIKITSPNAPRSTCVLLLLNPLFATPPPAPESYRKQSRFPEQVQVYMRVLMLMVVCVIIIIYINVEKIIVRTLTISSGVTPGGKGGGG